MGADRVVLAWKMTPPGHKTGPCRPATALPIPSVGDSASPWMWAKARTKLGAVIRLCGDGVRWNGGGSCRFGIMENDPSRSQNRTLPTRPPLPIPSVGDSASPWMWAKARSKRGAVIHLCGDAVRWNGGGIGSFFGIMENDPFRSQNRTLPTRHRTPDPQLWKFFLIC
jgi:hypothetical protein